MPSLRQVKRRIKSVQNTAKITRAMEMIAASKMRRAQQMVLSARPYANRMSNLLADLAAQPQYDDTIHPLLQSRNIRNIEVVLITPDRGLCGGLNANLNRASGQYMIENNSLDIGVITVGKKGRDFMIRANRNVKAVFTDMIDKPTILDIGPIARLVIDSYTKHDSDLVMLIYPEFINTVNQRPVVKKLLPIEPAKLNSNQTVGYIYEQGPESVLNELLPRFVEVQIFQSLLESIASEHSARMVSMGSATENANEMIGDLTLLMNKIRQDAITTELLDIVAGAISLDA